MPTANPVPEGPQALPPDAAARLAVYEQMHADVAAQRDRIARQIDERKAAGTLRGATANQLIAQKMTYQNMLSLYASYDLGTPPPNSADD